MGGSARMKSWAWLRGQVLALVARLRQHDAFGAEVVSLREALAAVSSQRDINLERAIAAENERHRNANLVRAVTDGIAHEQVTDIINAEGFDAVPWRLAANWMERAEKRAATAEAALRDEKQLSEHLADDNDALRIECGHAPVRRSSRPVDPPTADDAAYDDAFGDAYDWARPEAVDPLSRQQPEAEAFPNVCRRPGCVRTSFHKVPDECSPRLPVPVDEEQQ